MTRQMHSFRVTAALFAAVFGMAPVASSFHADDHAHVYCAEHQAIEESQGVAATAAASAMQTWATDAAEHDACPFLALTVRGATEQLTERGHGLVDQGPLRSFVQFAVGHPPVPVLLRAPKASPPKA